AIQPQERTGESASAEPEEEDEEEAAETVRVIRRPLPVVGEFGWRLVSFNANSLFAMALSLAALYVPAAILALALISRPGSFGVAFQRDYGSLLICAFLAWSASHLPPALAGLTIGPLKLGAGAALALWALGNAYFGALMILALRTACGASFKHAAI